MRRLCVANGLDRLWTLTYAVEPENEAAVRADLARFFERIQKRVGHLRYLYVIEHGSKSGRLHAHFATNRFLPKGAVAAGWNNGYVDGRRLVRGRGGDARAAATYLAKYVSKGDERPEGRERSRRRYVPSLGLSLVAIRIVTSTEHHAEVALIELMGGAPDYVWRSAGDDEWRGPPCVVAWWSVDK